MGISAGLLLIHPLAVEPAAAVHVQPLAVGFAGARVGAETQDVAIEILDLHFQRPRVVRGGCRILAPDALYSSYKASTSLPSIQTQEPGFP